MTGKTSDRAVPAPDGAGADRAWAIMDPVRGRIRVGMALGAGSGLAVLATMICLAMVIQSLRAQPGVWPLGWMLGALAGTVASYLARLGAFNQSHYAAFRLERLLRSDLAARLAEVPLGYVQAQGAGALGKVIHDDVKALHVFVADSTPLYARAYVTPLVTLALLLWLDWRLALAVLGVLCLGLLAMRGAQRRRHEMARLYNAAREAVAAATVEFVQAMPVVRSFDTGQTSFGRYDRALRDYLAVVTRWYRESGAGVRLTWAVLSPLPTLAVVLWLGVALMRGGDLTPDRWLAVLLLCTGMAESVMPMMMLRHMIDKVRLSITRIQNVLAAAPLPVPAVPLMPRDASVVFDHVSFSYGDGLPQVLSDISFTAAPGSVTALVGPSGAGKSTIARLIPRFWDVTGGRILIGGVDLRDLHPATLMDHVAFVFQENFLFADSIAENIRLGSPDATEAQVIAAARAAQAHDFIMALPQGYDSPAGERGGALSGGQRQRITIARAILQNRPILVLDEATAFADPENEAALIRAIAALTRGKTVIMVTHRLQSVTRADQILVVDDGHLVEAGSHDTLLARGGRYARLWDSHRQAQGWTLGGGAGPVDATAPDTPPATAAPAATQPDAAAPPAAQPADAQTPAAQPTAPAPAARPAAAPVPATPVPAMSSPAAQATAVPRPAAPASAASAPAMPAPAASASATPAPAMPGKAVSDADAQPTAAQPTVAQPADAPPPAASTAAASSPAAPGKAAADAPPPATGTSPSAAPKSDEATS
ncbi:ABC transporter ATP-binding protein [Paracoccus jiaweipingae]|uniref:ABC transporter ATP-binding protein n=1 Tax=unclassified Paracoccus (in: a-proteobacteria) TaxID=2688777 RepID=UPI00378842DE